MDEQKQIKQMLAERCAEKGKTPIYIDRLHGIKDIFGQPVALSDVKAGYIYKLSIDQQAMEDANIVQVHHHRDRYDTWTTHSTTKAQYSEKQIFVTDVLHHDGMVFIETAGAAYSTIDFPKEWSHVLENSENQKFTTLVLHAIDEQNKWFKDDSIKLAIQLDVMDDIIKSGCKKEMLNGMVRAISDYLEEHNPQSPFDKRTVSEIQSAAILYVNGKMRELDRADNLAIARELAATGIPLVYCRDRLEPEKGFRPNLEREEHVPDEKFQTFNLKMPMAPMTGIGRRYELPDFRMENLVLLDIKKTDSGKVFYITDRAILTHESMEEEYRQALEERGMNMDRFEIGMDMKSYLSEMNPNNRDIFCGHKHIEFEHFNGTSKKWESNDAAVHATYDAICAKMYEHGLTPTLITGSDYPYISNVRMLDANGVQHDVELENVCPGMKIMLIERESLSYDKLAGKGTVMEVQEFLRINFEDFAIVTDKGMFTTNKDFVDHYQAYVQNMEQEQVHTEKEGPVIGE